MTVEQKPLVNYLTTDSLEKICRAVAENIFGGEEPLGIFSDHESKKLETCLALPQQAVFGEELYPTIYDKAAILYFAINRNHPFGNGNKRMSAASVVVFLYINNLALVVDQKDFFEKTLWLATTTDEFDSIKADLSLWIQKHTKTLDDYHK